MDIKEKAEQSFPFLKFNELPEKPRFSGVT